MIKFLTILSIFIVLLNEIDTKSLDRPSKVSQRDGYEPTKDRSDDYTWVDGKIDGFVCNGIMCCDGDGENCYMDDDY